MIKNFDELATTPYRKQALEIINSGLEAVKTETIMQKSVKLEDDSLIVLDKKYDLNKYKRIVVVGFGKASSLMAKEIKNVLGDRIDCGLVISTKEVEIERIKVVVGTHPMPSLGNVEATKEMVRLLESLYEEDLVICLVSGGGSALLCYPNIPFDEYLGKVEEAFKSGIDIKEFNKLRKQLSNVKGGKLASKTKAKIVSLIFSDVVGDDLATIASGPTYDAPNVDNILLLNNMVALESMKKKAEELGLNATILTNSLEGEAREVSKETIKNLDNEHDCFLFAGETTVTVKGDGKGGRNQEFCLGALDVINDLVVVSIGTDGHDGPTDAAGAIVDKTTLGDFRQYLENNDAYNFLKKTNDLVITGLTGSNVADIGVIVKPINEAL